MAICCVFGVFAMFGFFKNFQRPNIVGYRNSDVLMGVRISVSLSQDTENPWRDTENHSLLWGENFGTSGEGIPKVGKSTPKRGFCSMIRGSAVHASVCLKMAQAFGAVMGGGAGLHGFEWCSCATRVSISSRHFLFVLSMFETPRVFF